MNVVILGPAIVECSMYILKICQWNVSKPEKTAIVE